MALRILPSARAVHVMASTITLVVATFSQNCRAERLVEQVSPYKNIQESSGTPLLLDSLTLQLLLFVRVNGGFDIDRCVQSGTQWVQVDERLRTFLSSGVPLAEAISAVRNTRDPFAQRAAAEQLCELLQKRATLLVKSRTYLLPERLAAIGNYDIAKRGFPLRWSYLFGFENKLHPGLFFPSFSSSEERQTSALIFLNLNADSRPPNGIGISDVSLFPLSDLVRAKAVSDRFRTEEMYLFYEVDVVPGKSAKPLPSHANLPQASQGLLYANLAGVVISDSGGEVVASVKFTKDVRL